MSITISVLLENRLNSGSINLLRAKAGLSLFIQDENDSILMVRRLNRFFREHLTMNSSMHYPNEDADLREFTCENDRVVPFLT